MLAISSLGAVTLWASKDPRLLLSDSKVLACKNAGIIFSNRFIRFA